eukprot:589295-Amphidinium_carterae.1
MTHDDPMDTNTLTPAAQAARICKNGGGKGKVQSKDVKDTGNPKEIVCHSCGRKSHTRRRHCDTGRAKRDKKPVRVSGRGECIAHAEWARRVSGCKWRCVVRGEQWTANIASTEEDQTPADAGCLDIYGDSTWSCKRQVAWQLRHRASGWRSCKPGRTAFGPRRTKR